MPVEFGPVPTSAGVAMGSALPKRSTVTIDGNAFDVASAVVSLSTKQDNTGMPEMGSLFPFIQVFVDLHDADNIPFSLVQKLFDLSNLVTHDKIVDMKIEFWTDETKDDVLCAFDFCGWINKFEVSNPMNPGSGGFNHLLYLELTPAVNEENFKEIAIGN